jgi:hypothetical protein
MAHGQLQAQGNFMPLIQTSGNVTADAYAGGVAVVPTYIEDVFVSWLSTGNGTSRTVTGPDMTKGGLSITKSRSAATGWHYVDTVRGAGNSLSSNTTSANTVESTGLTAFTATGTSIGAAAEYNTNGATYVDYLIKKQPKFFTMATWTGNGTAGRQITHDLGSVPGCIMVKRTSGSNEAGGVAGWWIVYHRGIASAEQYCLFLNTTDLKNSASVWNNTAPTSTAFTVGSAYTNYSGDQYEAYIFAHNAGGFGLTGTDNVISCGSFVNNTNTTVTLGYEPQWILVKDISTSGSWLLVDTMRGDSQTASELLYPNSSSAADAVAASYIPTATGFLVTNNVGTTGSTYIYIAIRRGPMKVPTDATKVFTPATRTGTGTATTITSAGFPVDLVIGNSRNAVSYGAVGAFGDRLRGKQNLLYSEYTNAEDTTNVSITGFDVQNGISVGDTTAYSFNYSGGSYVNWFMRRAPTSLMRFAIRVLAPIKT